MHEQLYDCKISTLFQSHHQTECFFLNFVFEFSFSFIGPRSMRPNYTIVSLTEN